MPRLSLRDDRPRHLALLGETFAPQTEARVEPRPHVLERHPPGKLDDLLLAEGTPQPFAESCGYDRRRSVARLGVPEHEPFPLVVHVTVAPPTDLADLLGRHAGLHALVVAVVDAPRAADRHRRRLQRQPG